MDAFKVQQGVAQGCSLCHIIFSIQYIQQVEIAIQLSSGKAVGGILFAADFVGISDSKESLQKLIDFVYSKWRLRANVSKSAMMFFF